MYLDFYRLREAPFNLTPDPDFFFMSAGHKQALSYLSYGILQRKGFCQLTGEVGSGKTMIVRRLLAELGESAVTAYVLNPADTFTGLLRFILKDFDVPLPSGADLSKTELLGALYQFLLDRKAEGLPVILIFDEAQDLSASVLEEIRLISNFETTKEKLIQIIFVGQPEFKDMIATHELRQLAQRIAIRYHLTPLSQVEMDAYVDHRLRVAGGDRIRVTSMAKEVMFSYTGGVPRLVNMLGDYALLVGYVNETFVLNHRLLTEAIVELEGGAQPSSAPDQRDPAWAERLRSERRSQRGRRIRRARRTVATAAVPPPEPSRSAPHVPIPSRTVVAAEPAPVPPTPRPVIPAVARVPQPAQPAPAENGRKPAAPMRSVIAAPSEAAVPDVEQAPAPVMPLRDVGLKRAPSSDKPVTAPAPLSTPRTPKRAAQERRDTNPGEGPVGAVEPLLPSLSTMLRQSQAARGAGNRPAALATKRRVVTESETGEAAASLAAQALTRGRQRADTATVRRPAAGLRAAPAAVIGDLPENWWQFAQPDDSNPAAAGSGWGAALGRLWHWLFGWLG